MIQVAAAILERWAGQDRPEFLICRRQVGGSCSELWEFPGGKVEVGETPEACVVRECWEELNLRIGLLRCYALFSFTYPEGEIAFTFFRGRVEAGELILRVHQDICWVGREDLGGYAFCPADVDVVARLRREG